MAKKQIDAKTANVISAQPRLHQRAGEIQRYGTVNHLLPLELEEPVRLEMTAQLNQDQMNQAVALNSGVALPEG